MSSVIYSCSVTKTTCREFWPHGLCKLALISGEFSNLNKLVILDRSEKIQLPRRKISITTVTCGASLVFASIGAGIGAMIVHPTTGRWIGCAIGDVSGPIIVAFCFDKVRHLELR